MSDPIIPTTLQSSGVITTGAIQEQATLNNQFQELNKILLGSGAFSRYYECFDRIPLILFINESSQQSNITLFGKSLQDGLNELGVKNTSVEIRNIDAQDFPLDKQLDLKRLFRSVKLQEEKKFLVLVVSNVDNDFTNYARSLWQHTTEGRMIIVSKNQDNFDFLRQHPEIRRHNVLPVKVENDNVVVVDNRR